MSLYPPQVGPAPPGRRPPRPAPPPTPAPRSSPAPTTLPTPPPPGPPAASRMRARGCAAPGPLVPLHHTPHHSRQPGVRWEGRGGVGPPWRWSGARTGGATTWRRRRTGRPEGRMPGCYRRTMGRAARRGDGVIMSPVAHHLSPVVHKPSPVTYQEPGGGRPPALPPHRGGIPPLQAQQGGGDHHSAPHAGIRALC